MTDRPPPSSARHLVWVVLGLALLVAALFLLVGDDWLRWFPSEEERIGP